jgi:hypothetical protein
VQWKGLIARSAALRAGLRRAEGSSSILYAALKGRSFPQDGPRFAVIPSRLF